MATDLARLAGWSTWLALVSLVLSAIALALFFAGAGEYWGPVNDVLISVTAVAVIPAVLVVARMAGETGAPWVRIVSVAAIAGLVLMAAGQLLLVVGRLSLDGSYVTGGIGVLPFLAWIVLVAVLALGPGILPARVGWLAVATLLAIAALAVTSPFTLGPAVWVEGAVLLAVLGAWLADLGHAFMTGAAIAASAAAAA